MITGPSCNTLLTFSAVDGASWAESPRTEALSVGTAYEPLGLGLGDGVVAKVTLVQTQIGAMVGFMVILEPASWLALPRPDPEPHWPNRHTG